MLVVNWNRKELLRQCLLSVRAQDGTPPEIVVVDNGSRDGSAEMVASEFPGAILIRNSENRGFCAANNQGMSASTGEFIALLNNDAEADSNWIVSMLGAMRDRTSVGMVACKILVHENPKRIDKAGHLIYPDGQNRGRGTGALDDGAYDTPQEVLWPDGCAALYRREMLDEIGGFDEDFFAYADDAELGLRGRIAGWRCWYAPDAVVRHHRGSTLGLGSARRLTLIERNRVLLVLKLFPWTLLAVNPFYYAARLAAGARASFGGAGETALFPGWRGKLTMAFALVRGDLQAIWMMPRMLRKRARVNRFRKLSSAEVRNLILENRIGLRELSTQAALR